MACCFSYGMPTHTSTKYYIIKKWFCIFKFLNEQTFSFSWSVDILLHWNVRYMRDVTWEKDRPIQIDPGTMPCSNGYTKPQLSLIRITLRNVLIELERRGLVHRCITQITLKSQMPQLKRRKVAHPELRATAIRPWICKYWFDCWLVG